MILANFQDVCEGYLGVEPSIKLFQWYYQCRPLYFEDKQVCNCGSASFVLRMRRKFPTFTPIESVRYWNRDWFYYKNLTSGN